MSLAKLILYDIHSDFVAPSEIILNHEEVYFGRTSTNNPESRSHPFISLSLKKYGKEVISRKHAKITRLTDQSRFITYIVYDLGAINGLFVNGKRITQHTLEHGDIIQFGGAANIAVGTEIDKSDCNIKYQFKHPRRLIGSNSADDNASNQILKKYFHEENSSTKSSYNTTSNNAPIQPKLPPSSSSSSSSYSYSSPSLSLATKDSVTKTPTKLSGSTLTSADSNIKESSGRRNEILTQQLESQRKHQIYLSNQVKNLQHSLLQNEKLFLQKVDNLQKDNNTANHQVVFLKQSIEELRSILEDKDNELSKFESEVQRLKAEIETMKSIYPPSPQNKSNKRIANSTPNVSCMVDLSLLKSYLTCSVCTKPFVNPVVLLCSHTFCRLCIEKSWMKYNCVGPCVICHDIKQIAQSQTKPISSVRPYVRSDTIENILWLLLEALPITDRKKNENREKESQKALKKLRIDAELPVSQDLLKLVSEATGQNQLYKDRDYDDDDDDDQHKYKKSSNNSKKTREYDHMLEDDEENEDDEDY